MGATIGPASTVSLTTRAARGLKRVVYPERDGLALVHFDEQGPITALVPAQERFGLMREIVLQRIYDQAGGIPDGVVVDAGANVGLFSLIASRHARRVVALEPDEINHHVLAINIATNGAANVEAMRAALWIDDGLVSFGRPEWEESKDNVASTRSYVHDCVNGSSTPVAAVTLESLVERLGDIDLLKMDIEGAELDVIPQTEALGHVRRLIAELHLSEPGQQESIIGALAEAGFHTRLVSAASLFDKRHVPTIVRNWNRLRGETLVKAGLVAYMMAPVPGKGVGPGRDLPLLIATRD